jgi:hypothetical protein
LSTTLLCLLYDHKQTVGFNALLFMIICLSYSSCYNIVGKFYWIISIMSMFRVLRSQLTMLYMFDQDCVGFMSPQKLFLLSITYSRTSSLHICLPFTTVKGLSVSCYLRWLNIFMQNISSLILAFTIKLILLLICKPRRKRRKCRVVYVPLPVAILCFGALHKSFLK